MIEVNPENCKTCLHSEKVSGKVKTAIIKCKKKTCDIKITNDLESGKWYCHEYDRK